MTAEERKKKTEEFLNKAVVLRPALLTFCDVKTALFLSQCLYWQERASNDGWFYKTVKEWQMEIGLTRKEQLRAKKILESLGVLETKFFHIPPKLYFKINFDKVFEIVSAKLEDIEKQEEAQKGTVNQPKREQEEAQKGTVNQPKREQEEAQKGTVNTIDYNKDYVIDYALDYNKDYAIDLDKDKVLVKKLDKNKVKNRSPVGEAFDFFNGLYEKLYNTKYLRNAKTMSQMKRIVESLREDEVKDVIEAFLNCREANVIKRAHDLGILLMDLQKYKVMCVNKLKIIDASGIEKRAKFDDVFERAERILKMRGERCSTGDF